MTDAISMEGEVDHEFTRRRPLKRSERATDYDRAEDRHINAGVHHFGERSAASYSLPTFRGTPTMPSLW
jgi:hypothetical protein